MIYCNYKYHIQNNKIRITELIFKYNLPTFTRISNKTREVKWNKNTVFSIYINHNFKLCYKQLSVLNITFSKINSKIT